MNTSANIDTDGNPLSSAEIRYNIRTSVSSATPGPLETRPFGLCFARVVPTPTLTAFTYCHDRQMALGDDGRPLIETQAKKWDTKSATDGDEGPEENWGWEE